MLLDLTKNAVVTDEEATDAGTQDSVIKKENKNLFSNERIIETLRNQVAFGGTENLLFQKDFSFRGVRFGPGLSIFVPLSIRKPKNKIPVSLIDSRLNEVYSSSNQTLNPGFYGILGRPNAGKSVLLEHLSSSFKTQRGVKVAKIKALEPLIPEELEAGVVSFVTAKEVSIALGLLLSSDADIVLLDSLRFYGTVSDYPAKPGGIPGGLELLTTVLDEAFSRAGKICFGILSTNSNDDRVLDIYRPLLEGSCQGLLIPVSVGIDKIGSTEGYAELTRRGEDRTYYSIRFNLENKITLTAKEESIRRFRERDFPQTGMTDGENQELSLIPSGLDRVPRSLNEI